MTDTMLADAVMTLCALRDSFESDAEARETLGLLFALIIERREEDMEIHVRQVAISGAEVIH